MSQKLSLNRLFGIELDPVSFKEKTVSALGGLVGIFLVILVCGRVLDLAGAMMLVASMGASAVLLFGVPHGQLAQPWPVLAGHGFSAAIGILCAKCIPFTPLAGACAVGLSIGVMHQLKCIHPPGGATALTAVMGGPAVQALGWTFLWTPVLLNALLLFGVAVLFNAFFPWRRYPAALNRPPQPEPDDISHEEVVAALESFDSFVDITEDDLIRLHHLLSRRVRPGRN